MYLSLTIIHITANTGHSPNAVSMLAHRFRRWPNIETALGDCCVTAKTNTTRVPTNSLYFVALYFSMPQSLPKTSGKTCVLLRCCQEQNKRRLGKTNFLLTLPQSVCKGREMWDKLGQRKSKTYKGKCYIEFSQVTFFDPL